MGLELSASPSLKEMHVCIIPYNWFFWYVWPAFWSLWHEAESFTYVQVSGVKYYIVLPTICSLHSKWHDLHYIYLNSINANWFALCLSQLPSNGTSLFKSLATVFFLFSSNQYQPTHRGTITTASALLYVMQGEMYRKLLWVGDFFCPSVVSPGYKSLYYSYVKG